MITIPIWSFVILLTLSLMFIVFITLFLLLLAKMRANDDKEWHKIFTETYEEMNWNNREK